MLQPKIILMYKRRSTYSSTLLFYISDLLSNSGGPVRLRIIRHTDVSWILALSRVEVGSKDVVVQGVKSWFSGFLSLENILLHLLADFLLLLLELCLVTESCIDNGLLQELQRITCGTSQCNFFTVTVSCSRIGHGVSVVTVGHHLNIHRTVSASTVVFDELHTLGDSQHVHSVDSNSRNGITHLVVITDTGVSIHRSSHTVVVVFNAKDHW
mmetsp:Transcript_9951/g.14300  ORF Transcript_9951/g.14300 Transcript_9951/m.14300 type:complete len:212 (-) Transcript_9951:645-1280(-)